MNNNKAHYNTHANLRLRMCALIILIPFIMSCESQAVVYNNRRKTTPVIDQRYDRPVYSKPIYNNFRQPQASRSYTNQIEQPEREIIKEVKVAPKPRFSWAKKAEEDIETALKAYKKLNWEDAEKILKATIKIKENIPGQKATAYVLLGAMAYQLGNVEEAKQYFTKASRMYSMDMPFKTLFPPALVRFYENISG